MHIVLKDQIGPLDCCTDPLYFDTGMVGLDVFSEGLLPQTNVSALRIYDLKE